MSKIKICLIAAIICLILGLAGGLFCGYQLFHNGTRSDSTTTDLRSIVSAQQSAIDRLGKLSEQLNGVSSQVKTISGGIGTVNAGLDDVKKLVRQSQDAATESAELINRGRKILEGVKKGK